MSPSKSSRKAKQPASLPTPTTVKTTNATLRLAVAGLNVLAVAPFEIVPNGRIRTARKILGNWFEPVEEIIGGYAQMFGHETVPGSGEYEFPAVNQKMFTDATRPLLEEEIELPVLRPISVEDVRTAGARLTPSQAAALEAIGLLQGAVEDEPPFTPPAVRKSPLAEEDAR
jgi:hypothetical protein